MPIFFINKDNFAHKNTLNHRDVFHLPDELIINRGSERTCYRHPKDNKLVIKVPISTAGKQAEANHNELKGYRILREEGIDLSFVSHCYGFVNTDQGQGLVCDCIRDDDGTISKTIWDTVVFQDDCDVEHVVEIAETFCDFLISNRIWIFDLNLKNIVLKQLTDGTCKPYIIDVKGRYVNYELIPFSRYISYFSLQKLRRRSSQLLQRIAEYHRRREELQMMEG